MDKNRALAYEKLKLIIQKLHDDWTPHSGQIEAGRYLFKDRIKNLFIQCGRKWGKTEFVIYVMWRMALSTPNAKIYYFSPTQKLSKEIIWAPKRLQYFGPREYLLEGSQGINKTELRMNFINGSFIKVDGSDNEDDYRGIDAHLVVFDEFKDFRPGFYTSMAPNLAVRNTPLLIVGTPPDIDCQYTVLAKEFTERDDSAHIIQPTWKNPHIPEKWLNTERQKLIARGEEDVWLREYEGKFIKGGKRAIFPMMDQTRMVTYQQMYRELRKDRNKLQWYCMADPGTTTCFAVLFIGFNQYSRKVYCIDEIYETDQRETSSKRIWEKIEKKLEFWGLDPDQVDFCRDEAASWFENEIYEVTANQIYFRPVAKKYTKKEMGLSNIKDMINEGNLVISDRCPKLVWEMENYVRDDKGKIPKENDHLIDSFRYFLDASLYSVKEEAEPKKEEELGIRSRSIREDLEAEYDDDRMLLGVDW